MAVEFTVISIGTLSHNRLWGETAAVRTAHATTTYVESENRRILVDPSLPAPILEARFNERTGKKLDIITDIFCTTLRPVHRRAIEAMSFARWWADDTELHSYLQHLEKMENSSERLSNEHLEAMKADLDLLQKFEPAPDKFTPQVSLFPLHGASPGSAGLLLTPPQQTIAIAGDAVITRDHLQQGQLWEGCSDRDAANESLQEVLELADVIIPGHDNLLLAPKHQWF